MPAFSWVAYTPAPGLEELDGTSLAWVESHCDDGKALLISQFRDKPRLGGVLCALLAGVQDLHDAAWQVLTERWLDTAEGVQLDMLGTVVDLPRQGWTDGTYRQLLRAQVLVLRSKGRWPDLFKILEALGVTLSLTAVDEPSMAAFRIQLGEEMDGDISPTEIFNFIERAKGAGIRFTLIFPTALAEEMFAFSLTDEPVADDDAGSGDSVAGLVGGELSGLLATTESA